MDTVTCPNCGYDSPQRAFYCAHCAAQLRCKACEEILVLNAQACIRCGTLVGEAALVKYPESARLQDSAINTLEYEETEKKKVIRARFSDPAVASMSNAISMMLAGGGRMLRQHTGSQGPTRTMDHELPALPGASMVIDATGIQERAEGTMQLVFHPDAATDLERIRRVFQTEGDQLKLIDSRLKAHTQFDFSQRLVVLLLFAYELNGRNSVPRAVVNEALDYATLNNSTTRSWLAHSQDLITDKDQFGLSMPGRERARAILAEVLDPSITNRWESGSRSQSRTNRKHSEMKGESSNRKAPRNSTVGKWAAAWKNLGLPIVGHEILKDRGNSDRSVFGLWAIHQATNGEAKNVGVIALAAFIFEVFDTKVHSRSLERALKSETAKHLVNNVQGTTFRITPAGIGYARDMAGGVTVVTSTPASAGSQAEEVP
jgi:hypothetical protein